jgi:hypothetical protein
MIIQRTPQYVEAPLYLRVPPGHIKKWSKHCRAYNACGRQVYFVQDNWYNNVYAPQYRQEHGGGHGGNHGHNDDGDRGDNGKHHGKGHGKGHNKD